MKFITLLLSFMTYALCTVSSSLGPWQFQEVQKTTIGANKMPVPMVILSPAQNSQQESKITAAKDIAEMGERIFLVVRLQQKGATDVLVMIEGGVGITVAKSNFLSAQSIWPDEKIAAIDNEEFMRIIDNANPVNALIKKEGSEPTNIFNGSPLFDFAEDLSFLSQSEDWRTLSRELLEKAHHQIPSQFSRPESDWGCGPNTGARSLILLGHEIEDFDAFVNECPKSWSLFADVGPTPTQLATYLREKDGHRDIAPQFDSYFPTVLWSLKDAINQNKPMIILIVRSTFSMHYVTIIGYNESEQRIAVMDTDRTIYWISNDDLDYWMNAEGLFLNLFISLAKYNEIVF